MEVLTPSRFMINHNDDDKADNDSENENERNKAEIEYLYQTALLRLLYVHFEAL